ncbi:MAG: DNA polymerase III subunit chi [Pseudomonadota bacterium]
MGDVLFYHLTRSPLPQALAMLLEKCLERGWRVAVRVPAAETLDRLDAQLWLGPEERFLPHGIAGGPHDARQPVLLTLGDAPAANAPDVLMSVEGAGLEAAELAGLSRACVLFDGADGAQLERARSQWKALTAAGAVAQYWSEESGRWQMKAQSGT